MLFQRVVQLFEAPLGTCDDLAKERNEDACEGLALNDMSALVLLGQNELMGTIKDARNDEVPDPAEQPAGLDGQHLGPKRLGLSVLWMHAQD